MFQRNPIAPAQQKKVTHPNTLSISYTKYALKKNSEITL